MIGSTCSSTKRRTLSRTARSSSEMRLSMLKKSSMAKANRLNWLTARGASRRRRDADLARLGPEASSVVDRPARLVLPLMDHLVEQCVEHLLPAVPPEVTPADGNLAGSPVAGCRVVPQPALHAA